MRVLVHLSCLGTHAHVASNIVAHTLVISSAVAPHYCVPLTFAGVLLLALLLRAFASRWFLATRMPSLLLRSRKFSRAVV